MPYTSYGKPPAVEAMLTNYCISYFKEHQMPLPKIEALQRSFEFGERKTLKLKVKQATNLIDAIHSAREFLADNLEYSRIEFAYDKMYYVIARLKDKE